MPFFHSTVFPLIPSGNNFQGKITIVAENVLKLQQKHTLPVAMSKN